MSIRTGIYIFGEVLFDCFPDGQVVLGGAPFNVAWHLQAFGDQPQFISRVGEDEYGAKVLQAMKQWGMTISAVEVDEKFPTGQVQVLFKDNEPQYDIVNNSAYDFILESQLPELTADGILYHGSLGLRNDVSLNAYKQLIHDKNIKIFLDVNLRDPWWNKDDLYEMLKNATWVKLNIDELQLLAAEPSGTKDMMAQLQTTYGLEQIIVTQGEDGAIIRTEDGRLFTEPPEKAEQIVDTVGAGDAFSSMYLHGLRAGLPVEVNLRRAQQFATKIVGLRGATTMDLEIYQGFSTAS